MWGAPKRRLGVVFIDQQIAFHDRLCAPALCRCSQNVLLVFQGDLGIGYNGGRQEGMGVTAEFTFQAQD